MRRLRPSPAMIVAVIALVASVTSGAYAAVNIANGSITNRMLADNSVWHRNIGSGSVRNFNMAGNSVWHAQIGTGSVRLINIQPATVDQLRSESAAFAHSGPTNLSAATQGVRVAGATIFTNAGANFLVLNGFVTVDNIGDTDDAAVCFYDIGGSIVGATQRAIPAKSEVQIGMVARDPVKAGPHTVDVLCRSTRTVGLVASDAQFTAIATG